MPSHRWSLQVLRHRWSPAGAESSLSGCFPEFFLSSVFRSLIGCLGVDVFWFILFGIHPASGICRFMSLAESGKSSATASDTFPAPLWSSLLLVSGRPEASGLHSVPQAPETSPVIFTSASRCSRWVQSVHMSARFPSLSPDFSPHPEPPSHFPFAVFFSLIISLGFSFHNMALCFSLPRFFFFEFVSREMVIAR